MVPLFHCAPARKPGRSVPVLPEQRRRQSIQSAIRTLRERITLLDACFSEEKSSMEYRDALKLAVEALEKEAGPDE